MIGNFINIFFAFDRNILIGKISLYFCRFFQLFFIAVCNKAVIEDRSLPPVNYFNNQFLNNNPSLPYFFNQSNCKVDMFSYKKTGLSARLLTMILTLQKARKYATFRYLFLFLRHQYHRLHMPWDNSVNKTVSIYADCSSSLVEQFPPSKAVEWADLM